MTWLKNSQAEFDAWQAEMAAREQEKRAAQDAKEKRRAQKMGAMLGPTVGVALHVPTQPSRHRQEPSEIDKQLAAERRQRVIQRGASPMTPSILP